LCVNKEWMLICILESPVVWIARDYGDQARAGHRSQGKYQLLTRSQGRYLVLGTEKALPNSQAECHTEPARRNVAECHTEPGGVSHTARRSDTQSWRSVTHRARCDTPPVTQPGGVSHRARQSVTQPGGVLRSVT